MSRAGLSLVLEDHPADVRARGLKPNAKPVPTARLPASRPVMLHVFPNFNVGGVQVRFAALVKGLGRRFEHVVVSLQGSYAAAALLPTDALVRIEPPPRPGPLFQRLRQYRDILSRHEPDVILTYNWGAIEFVLANPFRKTPHIHFEDGFGPEEAEKRLRRRSLTRRIALFRSHIVVPSRTLHGIAQHEWRLDMRRVHHIPNGIAPLSDGRLGGLPADLPIQLPRIIWAGALRLEKNPMRALRAFAALEHDAVLLIVGDGPLREPLQQEIDRLRLSDRVRLLGARSDTRTLARQCDILLLTSDTEQMPLVVLEAMDAGLPVVATDVGDVCNMVCEQNRRFVTVPSAQSLAGALNQLLASQPLRRSVGQANRERQRTLYHVDQMVETYAQLFDRVRGCATLETLP